MSHKSVLLFIDADIMLVVYMVSALRPARCVANCSIFETAGIFYLMFATFAGMSISFFFSLTIDKLPPQDIFFNTYHFSTGIGGLAYIGLGVGLFFAFLFGSHGADKIYKHVSICFHAKLTGFP